jgi:hypothetical protein
MTLTDVSCRILEQLADVTRQLDSTDFTRPVRTLSQATIGQHVRHTLEFFQCLERGLPKGIVNYDERDHNEMLQENRELALDVIDEISAFLRGRDGNVALSLEVGYERTSDKTEMVPSNYYRELSYNIEHAVHHMALIKIGLREVAPHVTIPPDFGVAVSTLRHQEAMLSARQA